MNSLLGKSHNNLDLLAAFAIALKHHLREERGHSVASIQDLVAHLDTFSALRARNTASEECSQSSATKSKQHKHVLYEPHPSDFTGNLCASHGSVPVEIAFHLAAYLEVLKRERAMDIQSFGHAIAQMNALMDVLATCERILRTRK